MVQRYFSGSIIQRQVSVHMTKIYAYCIFDNYVTRHAIFIVPLNVHWLYPNESPQPVMIHVVTLGTI